jgi:hypothetical protein
MRSYQRVCAILASLTMSACASIVSDNASTTYIETDPEKARCELHGQDFKRVIETPNSINLPSKAAPLTISCSATGYKVTTAKLDTELDGWVFGNIIFGGIVGVVVDVARGAGQKYPPKMSVLLEPERFSDTTKRDEFYGRRKLLAEDKWSRAIRDTQAQCSTSADVSAADCLDRVKKLQAGRDKELAELEEHRLSSTIGNGGALPMTTALPLAPVPAPQVPVTAQSPPPAAATPLQPENRTAQAESDVEPQLRKLKKLLDDGLITNADYETQKKRLLERM